MSDREWEDNPQWEANAKHASALVDALALNVGDRFDTKSERGCVVTSQPDVWGDFSALDSDGVECSFCTLMVLPTSIISTARRASKDL